eukprot:1688184-Rhodomonas_salina.1
MSDIAIACNELVSDKSADKIDNQMIGSLVKKLMEASGNVNIVAVQLWRAVAIGWYNAWEANPNVYMSESTELKLNVVQQLSHFESTKHPKLTPVAPPGVALAAFDSDYAGTDNEIYN